MVKRIARYGFKSGILPKPRNALPSLKTSWELEKEENYEFQHPQMAPRAFKGRVKPKKPVPTAKDIISNSAKEPTVKKEPVSEEQKWKMIGASIRRKYLADSLVAEEEHHKRVLEKREQKYQEARQHRLALQEMEDSPATKLTLPTIDSFLTDGPFVLPRTKEQIEELRLKREYNRKKMQLKVETNRSRDLLELYQKAGSYIINEQQLESAVTRLFSTAREGRDSFEFHNRNVFGQNNDVMARLFNHAGGDSIKKSQEKLTQELLGTTSNGMPGLPEVEDVLTGRGGGVLEAALTESKNEGEAKKESVE